MKYDSIGESKTYQPQLTFKSMNFMCSRVLLNLYQLIFNTLKRNKNRLQNQKRNENTTTYILHMNNYFTIYYYHQLFLFQKGKIPSETFLYAYQNKQRRRGKSKALVFIVKNKVEKRKKDSSNQITNPETKSTQ